MSELEIDIKREDLDHKVKDEYSKLAKRGLTEDLIREISKEKNEPEWMLEKRLKGFKLFNEKPVPEWGPDLSDLNVDKIALFLAPGIKESRNWDDVPDEIKETFDKLGIPEAEKKHLAGAGAQFESEMAYHNLKDKWKKKGVIFENMDTAVQKYPDIVKEYFMTKCVPVGDHKYAALHAAVWSGGTFIYVPEGVKVTVPLQAYFRMNAPGGGQFEHTLIIAEKDAEIHYIEGCSAPLYTENNMHAGCVEVYAKEGARVRYTSIENWSKNTYNLNTKRAIAEKNSIVEWIGGNLGSGVTMLYPCTVLKGENAKADHISIAYAGEGQEQDTGAKVIHLAPNTSSTIRSKSVSKDGGICTYRGLVNVSPIAKNVKNSVECDALMLDAESQAKTIPVMKINNDDVDIGHEASVGRISDESLFYLMSRGLSEEEALQMIVAGFIEPITKELPMEYAVELNRLIQLEMEGSVG